MALSCLSALEMEIEGRAEILQNLRKVLEPLDIEELSNFFRKVDSYASRFPVINPYHNLVVRKMQQQIYEMLDDLTAFLESYIGDNGDFVPGEQLLAKLG